MPRDFLQPSADPLVLYPFRFRDRLTGKWHRARYVATLPQIIDRFAEGSFAGSRRLGIAQAARRSIHGVAAIDPWYPLLKPNESN